ncbi:MAG TPA: DUF4440 domain-containing protein [Casimicrobiaceae bacterium]|nr:DUF4440 domain-containing protein [Casimicrobiaceae bacterium]
MEEEEVLRLEKEFSQSIVKNDAGAVGRFLADDWIIIGPDGGIIDRATLPWRDEVRCSDPRNDGVR